MPVFEIEEKKPGICIVGGVYGGLAEQIALELAIKSAEMPYIIHGPLEPQNHGLNRLYNRPRKTVKKCLHPSCENLTNHKRGYCSKECCHTHRRILNKRNK